MRILVVGSLLIAAGCWIGLSLDNHNSSAQRATSSSLLFSGLLPESVASLGSGQQRRRLADKYHPDKEDISCTMYFSNGTSATITQSAMAPPPEFGSDGGGGYGGGGGNRRSGRPSSRGDFWGWLAGQRPNTGSDGSDNGMPPPCRGQSSDDGQPFSSNSNNDDDDDDDADEEDEDEEGEDDDAHLYYNNDDPLPAPLDNDGEAWQEHMGYPAGDSSSSPLPTVAPTSGSTQPTATPIALVDLPVTTSVPQSVQNVATPPPLAEEQEEEQMPEPSGQPYYDVEQQEVDGVSYVENIVRVAVSVALPPILDRGIPKQVDKAVTKLMNITAALRSDEMIHEFLAEYAEDSSAAAIISTLMQLYPIQDIPYIIDDDQQLLFYRQYFKFFHRQKESRAFFWELVNKPTKPIPVRRIPATTEASTTSLAKLAATSAAIENTTNTTLGPIAIGTDVHFATWMVHPVAYRCYERDQDGNVVPILDTAKLSLIESQLHQWLEFHVNTAREIVMGKLARDHALGIVMPGDEYDVELEDDHWTVRPHHTSTSTDTASSSDEDGPDDGYIPEGTYTEPLEVEPGIPWETMQQRLGWALLACTTSLTVVWVLIAYTHRRRQQAQEVWGAHVGTEQALQELLNVGWSIREVENDRQLLIIYDKSHHGMGYNDEDSMLMGGYLAPSSFTAD